MAGDEEKNIVTGMEEHVTKRIDPDELFASCRSGFCPLKTGR